MFGTADPDPFAPITRDTQDRGLLALDLATKTGWCTRTSSGVWDLNVKRDESKGMKLQRLRSKLYEINKGEQLRYVVFERPAGQHKSSIIVASELMAVVKMYCDDHAIEYRGYSAAEIKKFATGKGNAGKPEMVKAAKIKYGIDVYDDNEADALHLYHLAIEDLKL
jgi:crossover junction endodeoxyribonuclease RuvC